jgi:hypothetical protein
VVFRDTMEDVGSVRSGGHSCWLAKDAEGVVFLRRNVRVAFLLDDVTVVLFFSRGDFF